LSGKFSTPKLRMSTAAAIANVVEEDDNKLVTSADLVANTETVPEPVSDTESVPEPPVKNFWSDTERLARLQAEMQKIATVRIPVISLPEAVLLMAMAEVLAHVGWPNYAEFDKTRTLILTSNKKIPFAMRPQNVRTGAYDFWIKRSFIRVRDSNGDMYFEFENKKYDKREIFMSREFCNYLRDFCNDMPNGLRKEVQFWIFNAESKGTQKLDPAKVSPSDLALLKRQYADLDFNDFVMLQFKHREPEQRVGAGAAVAKQVVAKQVVTKIETKA